MNLRPPHYQCGALTKLSYVPKFLKARTRLHFCAFLQMRGLYFQECLFYLIGILSLLNILHQVFKLSYIKSLIIKHHYDQSYFFNGSTIVGSPVKDISGMSFSHRHHLVTCLFISDWVLRPDQDKFYFNT